MNQSLTRLLPPDEEARRFWRLRGTLLVNTVRQALQTARLRLSMVLVLSVGFWLALFWLFLDGFGFLNATITPAATRDETVRLIYGVFFVSLMVMLVFSTGVMLYGGLYRSPETRWLLTMPARPERIFLHKFQETMLLSSWGFFLLGSPMLLAYGLVVGAPWYYYVLLLPCLVAFVYIPGVVGAAACLLIVRHFPRRPRTIAAVAAILLVLFLVLLARSLLPLPGTTVLTSEWFQDVFARLRFSEHRLLPSWWLSTGLLEATRHQWAEALLFSALLFSNALIGHQAIVWLAGRTYCLGYSRLEDIESPRRRAGVARIDRVILRLCRPLPWPMRLLIVKDLRLFRRDPLQWSQFLIFFGLIGLYFLNIRRLSYDPDHGTWINMVSFLNLAVVGLILSTFTSRFIYPMISLEGRRFWIIGRLPLDRDMILWSKFLFATFGSLVPCLSLILISDVMLRVVPLVLAIHMLCCVLLCLGLSGIAVGMGATMPDMREESPSKIAAGFGGTLNLVVSTMYIVAVVALTAVPCHFYLATQGAQGGEFFDPQRLRLWIGLGTLCAVLLGIVATALPLWVGFRAFRRLES